MRYPINFETVRPDKGGKRCIPDWPIPIEKSPTGYGVVMSDEHQWSLARAPRKWEDHFVAEGWTETRFFIYQDCVDEPGFHMAGERPSARRWASRVPRGAVFNDR